MDRQLTMELFVYHNLPRLFPTKSLGNCKLIELRRRMRGIKQKGKTKILARTMIFIQELIRVNKKDGRK